MRLLNTSTLELQFFNSPEAVEDGYVALSHVWNEREDSFQDLQRYHNESQAGKRPHDRVSEKIRMCCEVAAKDGHKWVWIDTCCIDKTSSAELTEAINSMFRYYALSKLCYAFLRDVPTEAFHDRSSASFENSEWHRRGWTLQELVAPRTVLFLSSSWECVGSKADLAEELERITSIPSGILRLELRPTDMSIAQRMSWAARRQTTRTEDEAYCLLGIFDITMPTLYGEGRKAFRRLQEEIMKVSPDTTLFAWGSIGSMQEVVHHFPDDQGLNAPLFAISPRDYQASGNVKWYHPTTMSGENTSPEASYHQTLNMCDVD